MKYAAAGEALGSLSEDPGVTVLHGVDATDLPRAPGFSFGTVVWNFPYPDDVSLASAKRLREDLLGPFFACVGNVLEDGGRVWLTLAEEQGGSTREVAGQRKNVDIESIAIEHGFELLEVRERGQGAILLEGGGGGNLIGARQSYSTEGAPLPVVLSPSPSLPSACLFSTHPCCRVWSAPLPTLALTLPRTPCSAALLCILSMHF